MKRILASLLTCALMAAGARAAVLMNEPFTYPNGSITAVSGGNWASHSGTAGQVQVTSNTVFITQAASEDVNRIISGAPYTNGSIYVSFSVNFSILPVGTGNFFLHFKDTGTQNFAGRIYATTAGAAAGQFRLGIARGTNVASGAGIGYFPQDLSTNVAYTVVFRLDPATFASTIWVNPAAEADTHADASDTFTGFKVFEIDAIALRQSTANSAGMGAMTIDNLLIGTTFADVASGSNPSQDPPSLSTFTNQSIAANASTAAIPFIINDGETPTASLVLSKTSSNPTLVPTNGIVFDSSTGSNRTVTVTPAAGQQGSATIGITVTDTDNNVANRSFVVTVGAPSISTFSEIIIRSNTPSSPIAFTVTDAENDTIVLSAASSDSNVVDAVTGISFVTNSGSSRTITVTPVANKTGVATINVIATDGFSTTSNSFVVTVAPLIGLVFQDNFDSYLAGDTLALNGNNFFAWFSASGTGGQILVTPDHAVSFGGSNTEDVASAFMPVGTSFAPSNGVVLYTSFQLTLSSLPIGNGGDYLEHLKDTTNGSNFRCKVFALTNGAAAGTYRLGVSCAANTITSNAVVATDLALNTTYTVVTRYNGGTGTSKLWVNPGSESSSGVLSTDAPSTTTNGAVGLREAGSVTQPMGNMILDNLLIGTSFSDVVTNTVVVPTATTLGAHLVGNDLHLFWTTTDTTGLNLESTTSLTPPVSWTPVNITPDIISGFNVVTISNVTTSGLNTYYHLKY